MKIQHVGICGGNKPFALLAASAFKTAFNWGQRENFHPIFTVDNLDIEIITGILLPPMRAKYKQEVKLHLHLLEPMFSSVIAMHPFVDALTRKGHQIKTLLHSDPSELQTWKGVLEAAVPKQQFTAGSTVAEVIPPWSFGVDGVAGLVRSADEFLKGSFDGLAQGAKMVCGQRFNQLAHVAFLTQVCKGPNGQSPELTAIVPLD